MVVGYYGSVVKGRYGCYIGPALSVCAKPPGSCHPVQSIVSKSGPPLKFVL